MSKTAAPSQASPPSSMKAPERLIAASPPLTSGLAAVPICTLSASQPKAAPRRSPGTSVPPSE